MARTTVHFRGEDMEVIYTDYGYEPDTNAHEIDWHWADPGMFLELMLTDAELDSIEDQIREAARARESDHHEGDY